MQLLERLARHASNQPNTPAYVDAGLAQHLTWKELQHHVTDLSGQLKSHLPANSVVMICGPNSIDFAIAFLAVLAAGCTPFPISSSTPAADVVAMANQTGAPLLIELSESANIQHHSSSPAFSSPRPPLRTLRSLRFKSLTAENAEYAEENAEKKEKFTGLLLQSSGSTGKPKIVCRSLASLDTVCFQMCQSIEIGQDDRVLATVPLYHSYGLEHGLLAPVWAGATVHLTRGLELPLIQRELQQSHITLLPAVPSMYEMLANLLTHGEKFPALRAAYSAGAPLPVNVADRFFAQTGIRISQLFGTSEIGSVTYASPLHPHFDPASVGQPMPGVKIRIENGHLAIASPSMFSGYLGQPTTITPDGFYTTGDLARTDNHGNLFITGRTKLLIDIGGLKVNPIEVEEVLKQHAAIRDCVVIPMQQSETVVRLKAIITMRVTGLQVPMEELRHFARDRLAGYKVPRVFEVRNELPRTETGKVLRQMVK